MPLNIELSSGDKGLELVIVIAAQSHSSISSSPFLQSARAKFY